MSLNYKLEFIETLGEWSFALDPYRQAYVISLNGKRFAVRPITKTETPKEALVDAKQALRFVGPLPFGEFNGLSSYRWWYGF